MLTLASKLAPQRLLAARALFSSKIVTIPIPQAINSHHAGSHPSQFDRDPNDLVRMNRTGSESIVRLFEFVVVMDAVYIICMSLTHPLDYFFFII